MSLSSHSSISNSRNSQIVHWDCKNLDSDEFLNQMYEVKRKYCLKAFVEYRTIWWWNILPLEHPDLIFIMKDLPDVLIVSFHENGVDRLLCSSENYEMKKKNLYNQKPRLEFYDYQKAKAKKYISILHFWGKITQIGKENYSTVFNNCRHKVDQFQEYFQTLINPQTQ